MRVIRFRAWHRGRKEMIYDVQDICGFEEDGLAAMLHTPDMYEVMQFTGLSDKSGKEVWEGDIIKEPLYPSLSIVVEFKNGGFWLMKDGHGKFITNDIEVLGNIYENPEILNEK